MATLAQPPSTGPHLDNRRIGAALIDLAVPAAIAAAAYAAGLSLTRGVLLVALGWTLYYFFALESGDGQTLGKRVTKLRVVSADGSPASMEQIAKRTLVRILDGHIVGLIVMLATGERRQRLGDIVAGTVVTDAEAASETATEAPAATQTSARLAPVRASEPSPEKVPWHKRSLKMPALSKPSLPSLRRRSRHDDEARTDTGALTRAPLPATTAAEPAPEVRPFHSLDAPREEYESYAEDEPHEANEAPAPIEDFMDREVAIEREPAVAFEDEPSIELDDEASVEVEHEPLVELERAPSVEVDEEPEYDLQIDREPAVEFDEPEPVIERETEEQAEDSQHEPVTIKPIETVSAIDLVMQDAEDRRPGSQ